MPQRDSVRHCSDGERNNEMVRSDPRYLLDVTVWKRTSMFILRSEALQITPVPTAFPCKMRENHFSRGGSLRLPPLQPKE